MPKASAIAKRGSEKKGKASVEKIAVKVTHRRSFLPHVLGAITALVSVFAYQKLKGDDTDATVAPSFTPSEFRPLGRNQSKVWSSEQFLSVDEVNYLLNLVDAHGGWVPSKTGGGAFEQPSQDSFGVIARADPVVRRVEERISEATGIPIHPHE